MAIWAACPPQPGLESKQLFGKCMSAHSQVTLCGRIALWSDCPGPVVLGTGQAWLPGLLAHPSQGSNLNQPFDNVLKPTVRIPCPHGRVMNN